MFTGHKRPEYFLHSIHILQMFLFFRYFTALANGDPLPVKRQFEQGGLGLTIGLLDVLYQQLKDKQNVSLLLVEKKWTELGLPKNTLNEIVTAGGFVQELDFMKFFAVASSHLGGGVSVIY